MWKIFFEYSDKSKVTITGKNKEISLELAEKYNNQYKNAESAIYQQYPKKDNKQIQLVEKIMELRRKYETKNMAIKEKQGQRIE